MFISELREKMSSGEEDNLKLDFQEPTDEDTVKWALSNIKEDPDTREQDLSELRDLIFGE